MNWFRWNPTVEEQAIDRAHRIGQTRPVHVTRIIIKGAFSLPFHVFGSPQLVSRILVYY